MFKLRKPRTSKKYCEQILHFLLRYPCRTKLGILCAINGESSIVLNCLGELYDKGIVDVCYTNFNGAYYYINNSWIEYALKCKPGRRK